jgi:hypothetical protein
MAARSSCATTRTSAPAARPLMSPTRFIPTCKRARWKPH